MKIRIDRRLPLPGIPSASGIASTPQGLFVIGDDTPWLYRLDPAYRIVERIRIHAAEPAPATGRIPKATKPDFEALAARQTDGGSEFFVFGSGSLPRTRERLAIVNTQSPGELRLHDLSAYYAALREAAKISVGALNIEAAALRDDALYLFDRGSNVVAQCALSALRAHLERGAPCPAPQIRRLQLPSLARRVAGFSGAAQLPDAASFLFTASVECSEGPIADGAVLGSFLGIFDPALPDDAGLPCEVLRDAAGAVLPVKVEGVAVLGRDTRGICQLLMVTDNDDGDSELLEATFAP